MLTDNEKFQLKLYELKLVDSTSRGDLRTLFDSMSLQVKKMDSLLHERNSLITTFEYRTRELEKRYGLKQI